MYVHMIYTHNYVCKRMEHSWKPHMANWELPYTKELCSWEHRSVPLPSLIPAGYITSVSRLQPE